MPAPSRRSLHGLDWLNFFVANVQTGFGPFVAVYLTTQKWTQVEIGFVLSIGGLIGLIGQMPGGAIVDAARSERLVASLAVGGCNRADTAVPVPGNAFVTPGTAFDSWITVGRRRAHAVATTGPDA